MVGLRLSCRELGEVLREKHVHFEDNIRQERRELVEERFENEAKIALLRNYAASTSTGGVCVIVCCCELALLIHAIRCSDE